MSDYKFSDKETYELIKQGVYEVTLDEAVVKTFKTDATKEYLSLKFIIRQDVEQPHGNRVVFESVFRDKAFPTKFDNRKLQKIILTQKGKDTFQTEFANEDELIQYLNGLNMQITINEKEPDAYRNEPYNEVAYLSYRPSNVVFQTIGQAAPKTATTQYVVDESELPF